MLQAHCGSLLLDPAVLAQVHRLERSQQHLKAPQGVCAYVLLTLCMNAISTKCTRTKAWMLSQLPCYMQSLHSAFVCQTAKLFLPATNPST